MTELSVDTNALAYSGRALSAAQQAAKTRRWGWWYQAEWRLLSMKAYWTSVLGWAVLTPVLYVLAMGMGLGGLVDASSGGIGGVPYLVFVAPGLLVTSVVMSVGNEMMFPVMSGFKWHELYFARSATAGSAAQVAMSELVAVAIRAAFEATLFWLVLLALGATSGPWSWLMIPIATVAAMAMGAPIAAYSAWLKDEGYQFAFLQRFVLIPMFLFAGTFFPLESMPVYLQWVGWISPMWHGTQLARATSYGLPLTGIEIAVHLAFVITLVAVGAWLMIRNFTARSNR